MEVVVGVVGHTFSDLMSSSMCIINSSAAARLQSEASTQSLWLCSCHLTDLQQMTCLASVH
jgi:hypothetical protein